MTDLVAQLVGALDRLMLAVDVAEDGCTHGGFGPGYENGLGYECGTLIQAARAEARAALTAAKAGGWLPIETAPKDGTVVILGRVEDGGSVVTTGHWQEAEEDGVDYMGADAGFVDEHYQEFNPGRSFGSPSHRYAPTQPTAWQPIPNPPKGEV